MVSNSTLHYEIIRHIIEKGYAPDTKDLAAILQDDEATITQGLYNLADYHGVVLHPSEPKVWVIHPFSLAPTNFFVKSQSGSWWANCAWCSLGVAALLNEDVTITTSSGAHGERIDIHIVDGQIQERDLYIHFPVRMRDAWNNVIYTCSNMLVFRSEQEVDEWVAKHNISKGDVQPISTIWEFSKKWYGNHLNPEWQKWTTDEAREIFRQFGLTGETWNLESSGARF